MNIFDKNKIHESWKPFFTKNRITQIKEIEAKIRGNINPSPENVFRFATVDLKDVRVCILGQDPYPSKTNKKNNERIHVATGRAFEVGTLTSWTERFAQHSLKNIVKLIYKAYNNELVSYDDIKNKIINGEFSILPPNKLFNNLEEQGVLFLNTSLTCEAGKANSHKAFWKDFSKDIIRYMSEKNPDIYWFLWGSEAHKNDECIQKGVIYKSHHPRLYNSDKPNAFLNSTCFEDTKDFIEWRGLSNLQKLRTSLPNDLNDAILELREIIKKISPKTCYFNNIDDFVAPFTITCQEEMLMQLLLMEKELEKEQTGISVEELKKQINKEISSKKDIDKKFLKQAEEGYIRRFVHSKERKR